MHMKRIYSVRAVLAYTDHIKHRFWSPCSMWVKVSYIDHGTIYICLDLHRQALSILHTFSLEV